MADDERKKGPGGGASPGLRTVPAEPRQILSRDLLAGGRELVIVHEGRRYFLRVTQNGKLILTA